jgi:sigma54-dependent transcription regulator
MLQFGHVKGAFTGAGRDARGLVSEATAGTLFLDEIAEMSPPLQAKLLDVLERHVVRAVGATKERTVDVRIVAATHRDLAARVAAGTFRDDLRYRLDLVSIELPPLRHTTIGPDFGYTSSTYLNEIDALFMNFASDPNVHTYIVTSQSGHVVESVGALASDYLPWMTTMVTDGGTWMNGTYP